MSGKDDKRPAGGGTNAGRKVANGSGKVASGSVNSTSVTVTAPPTGAKADAPSTTGKTPPVPPRTGGTPFAASTSGNGTKRRLPSPAARPSSSRPPTAKEQHNSTAATTKAPTKTADTSPSKDTKTDTAVKPKSPRNPPERLSLQPKDGTPKSPETTRKASPNDVVKSPKSPRKKLETPANDDKQSTPKSPRKKLDTPANDDKVSSPKSARKKQETPANDDKPSSTDASSKSHTTAKATDNTVAKTPKGEKPQTANAKEDKTSAPKSAAVRSNAKSSPEVTEAPSPAVSVGDGTSRLLALAQKGEWSVLDQILRAVDKVNPIEISAADEETGLTSLMLAVRENRLVIAERLADLGASVNEKAKDGRTPLHLAAAYCRDDMVKLLLGKKADPTVPGGPKEQLPLHMACSRPTGVLNMVALLLKASKDSRLATDKDGAIPLFLAADIGNQTAARELLTQQTELQVKLQRKSNGDTVMHVACRRKDLDMARLFLDSGVNVDAQNHEGHTALHLSSWEGDEVMVKFLHQVKANPNIVDEMDRTPLHIAAERGHTGIVETLVDKFRANISARTKDGSTLIHIASQYGHPETAMAFLKKGVPLHMPNKAGAICLHAAAARGHVSVIKALLQKGAPVDVTTKEHYTALHISVEHCKPQAVQTLLGMGAQVELKGGKARETPLHIASRVKDGEKCAEMLLKSGADVNAAQENGETALHIAARHGQLKMVQALLQDGGDPMWQSKAGETALHISVRYCHWEVADELLSFVTKTKSRVDSSMLVNLQNSEGETALHYAAEVSKKQAHHEFEDTDIIKTILDYGGYTNVKTKLTQESPMHYCARAGNADVLLEMVKHIEPNKVQNVINQQAKNGWSSLLVACEQGHLEILRILLKNHARVDVFDEHGNAALHLAAENGHEKVADLLLKHKAFVNAKSKLGVTPLHMAAQNGFNNFVKLLIQTHGAATDALSLAKKTPLHMAAQYGRISVCSTLLKMKADANATDVHGQTPLHLAGENDHSDVVKLFLKHQPDLVTMACTNGMTCAHVSACKGSVAVIKELMRFNKVIVITARNRTNDSTSLHLAAAGGHPELVRFLLDAGASATDENADGMTAIHLAARFGHIQVVHALQGKVSYNVTSSKTGLTALHVAAQHGQMDFVREMLSEVPATIRSEPPHHGDVRDTSAEHGLTPLHLASQSGHEGLVRLLLNSPGVQADAPTAVLGVIPLHMAAQNGHTAVVSLLLSKSTNQLHVKDKRGRTGLLLAAANGHINMVSLLLGQGAEINGYDRNGWTALHHSAKAGHLDVVTLLVEAGALPDHETKEDKVPICYAASANHAEVLSYLMKKDHDTQHLMDNDKFVFDLMHNGKMSDNRSIKEFVLTSPAPVDTAVKLSQHFRLLAVREKERAKDLVAAGDFCETMATELMAIAASISSASSLLKSVDSRGIPLLDVLIECEQKEVMSHAAVQKYLSEVWTGQLSHWAGWKMMVLFVAMLFVPIVWLFLSLPIKHRFNKVPVIKFMSYLVSHIYLIALFILTTVYPLYPIWESTNLLPHWYEWLLLAWLSGLVVSQLTNPEDRAGLGWIKVIIIALCAIATSVQVIAFLLPHDDRMTCLYIRNQLFGLSLTLCFIQLLDFLSFHYLFGPWAIIIRDLMKDLIRFLVILCIFMLGFTLQLAAIYRPMKPPSPFDLALGTGDGGGGAPIETPLDTFELLFFALFGLVEPENLPPVNRHPMWTVTLVKGVFAGYLIITLIVLINLLIAMMSDTYQRIQAQSDTEWKFGRAKLFRNMNRTSATPSPMNLLTKLFTYCKILIKHRGKVCRMDAQKYVDEEEDLDDGAADSRSADHSGSHVNWLQRRRNTAVVPESGFLHAAPKHHGPIKVEDVVDWPRVIKKYQALQGVGDALDTADAQDDAGTDTLNEVNEKKEDGAAT